MTIKFGTDGWRGVIAEDFTFENVRKVAQAMADYVQKTEAAKGKPQVVVGYDKRFLSEEYAKAVCEVLAANNITALFTGKPTPTPAITMAIKKHKLSGGIILTASHNPPKFNGIKFKTKDAAPADGAVTAEIESLIGKNEVKHADFDACIKEKTIKVVDIDNDYLNFIKHYIDFSVIKNKNISLLVDYMHGTGAGYFEKLLDKSRCRITALHAERNPSFGGNNPEPVPKNLKEFLKNAKSKKADLAVALDGDSDRIGGAGADGEYLGSGQIISLILLHLLECRKLRGKVIKTISGTNLIEKIARDFGLELIETPVGFKHISKIMLKEDVLIGGEESGGIGFKGYIPERDGLVSGLFLLEMVAKNKKPIHKIMNDVYKRYGRYYYDRLDVELPVAKGLNAVSMLKKSPPDKLSGKKIKQIKSYDGIKFILEDSSWLLIRASGTEPIIRIYAEALSKKDVNTLLNLGKELAFKWN